MSSDESPPLAVAPRRTIQESRSIDSKFIGIDDADRRKDYESRRKRKDQKEGVLSSATTRRWIGLGSLISILCGVLAGVLFKDLSLGILLGVMGELVSLTLGFTALLNEVKSDLLTQLREHNELFTLVHRVAETDDPPLTERFNTLTHALWSLKEGHYKLTSLEEVYEDDKQSIRALQHHEILRSTCPVRGNEADVTEQLQNKSLLGSIEAHKEAAKRGVFVVRVFSFESKELSQLPLIKQHIDELEAAGIECYCIFPNEPEFSQVRQVPTDFVIFGNTKVSVGVLSTKGIVAGADVNYNADDVRYYKDRFRILIDLADRFAKSEKS